MNAASLPPFGIPRMRQARAVNVIDLIHVD
jgi:hypothetical protein